MGVFIFCFGWPAQNRALDSPIYCYQKKFSILVTCCTCNLELLKQPYFSELMHLNLNRVWAHCVVEQTSTLELFDRIIDCTLLGFFHSFSRALVMVSSNKFCAVADKQCETFDAFVESITTAHVRLFVECCVTAPIKRIIYTEPSRKK